MLKKIIKTILFTSKSRQVRIKTINYKRKFMFHVKHYIDCPENHNLQHSTNLILLIYCQYSVWELSINELSDQ